jgi:hypothetical protein
VTEGGVLRFEIGGMLQPRNLIEVEFDAMERFPSCVWDEENVGRSNLLRLLLDAKIEIHES